MTFLRKVGVWAGSIFVGAIFLIILLPSLIEGFTIGHSDPPWKVIKLDGIEFSLPQTPKKEGDYYVLPVSDGTVNISINVKSLQTVELSNPKKAINATFAAFDRRESPLGSVSRYDLQAYTDVPYPHQDLVMTVESDKDDMTSFLHMRTAIVNDALISIGITSRLSDQADQVIADSWFVTVTEQLQAGNHGKQ